MLCQGAGRGCASEASNNGLLSLYGKIVQAWEILGGAAVLNMYRAIKLVLLQSGMTEPGGENQRFVVMGFHHLSQHMRKDSFSDVALLHKNSIRKGNSIDHR